MKTEGKPWYSKKLNATKTEPYEPYQFVGLYICKERNGVRCLGTIESYSPEKNNMLKVWLVFFNLCNLLNQSCYNCHFLMFVCFNLIMSTDPRSIGNIAKKI